MAHHLEPSDNEEIHDDGHYLVTIWPNSDQIVTKQQPNSDQIVKK